MIDAFFIQCVHEASHQVRLPAALIGSVLLVEGGRAGTISPNLKKRDGRSYVASYDLGPMQINTIHLPELSSIYRVAPDVIAHYLVNDACYNIKMGAWLLHRRISEAGGDVWRGVAAYHSKTPQYGARYLRRVAEKYPLATSIF